MTFTRFEWALITFVVAICAALILTIPDASGHETMGHWQHHSARGPPYLYGHRIGSELGTEVNCCLYNDGQKGSTGDCRLVREDDVRIVEGGYLLKDGEFIAHTETSVSPPDPETGEYDYFRCQIAGAPSHCFFAPPRGM